LFALSTGVIKSDKDNGEPTNIWKSSSVTDKPVKVSSVIRTYFLTSDRSVSVVPFIFMFLMHVCDLHLPSSDICFVTCGRLTYQFYLPWSFVSVTSKLFCFTEVLFESELSYLLFQFTAMTVCLRIFYALYVYTYFNFHFVPCCWQLALHRSI
jgi:hypothetical protein